MLVLKDKNKRQKRPEMSHLKNRNKKELYFGPFFSRTCAYE